MKRTIFILCALFTTFTIMAQTLDGNWTGKLNVMGTQLNIIFNITKVDGNALVCTMDCPDQGVRNIPADIIVTDGVNVKINVNAINASYEGKLKDDLIEGTFSQSGMSFPLNLKMEAMEIRRPQTPKEPYPYKTEEVSFTNTTDNVTLSGTLTYPLGYEKGASRSVPLVVMVTGSGQQNRDEELLEHKPFLVLADYLARNGIASLRYDDRGTGKSTGDVNNTTTENFMKDALAAVDFARNTKNFGHVGVLGHSEGGTIAFMIGAQGKANFIVSLAGLGVKGADILLAQNQFGLLQNGTPVQVVADFRKVLVKVLRVMSSSERVSNPAAKVQKIAEEADVTIPAPLMQDLAQSIDLCTPWLRYFINYDPAADIRAVKCPVMAINGSKDTQVFAEENLPAIRRLLPESNLNIVKEYPGLNHLFQHCTTGLPIEYFQIEETMSPEVMQDITIWIKKVTENKKFKS